MKKCPRCETNWILDDGEELCEICKRELSLPEKRSRQTKPNAINDFFTFKSGNYTYKRKSGFMAYNSKGEHVGIVFMTDDKRTPAYGHCELLFFPEYHTRYGEWHRFTSNGERVSWAFLCNYLKTHREYLCFID